MKPIFLALIAVSIASFISYAGLSDYPSQEDIMELKESVLNLEEQLQLIREDCQTLAESLNFQNSSDLEDNLELKGMLLKIASGEIPFSVENGAIRIGKDTKVYLGDYELTELLACMAESEAFKADDNQPVSSPSSAFSSVPTSLSAISYVTQQQFQPISDAVYSLLSDVENLKAEVSALSSKIGTESGNIKKLQSDSQSLASRIKKLEEQAAKDLESGLYMTDVNLVSGGKAPNVPPEQYIAASSWGSAASSFMVTEDSVLESVTLYFPSSAKAASVKQVYLTDLYNQNKTFPATRTVSGSYYTYKFNNGPNLECSKQYFIVLSGVIPYVCPAYRANGLYMPSTALLGVNAVASATSFWKNADERYEIWNEISFKKASFKIDQRGLNVTGGKLKVNNSEVVTKETICQDLLNSITYDMFASPLKNMLLKTTGGSINGNLKVSGKITTANADVTGAMTVKNLTLKSDGAWRIGTSTVSSDIVIANPNGSIRSEAGNLLLAAKPGSKILAGNLLEFGSPEQGGVVEISVGQYCTAVTVDGLTKDAVVMLTPMQGGNGDYWYEATDGQLTVKLSDSAKSKKKFSYFIVKK